MANITPHSTQTIDGVDESAGGKQRFLFTRVFDGKIISKYNPTDIKVLVQDEDGNKQLALATVNIASVSTSSVESVNGNVGVVSITGDNLECTYSGNLCTLNSALEEIKADLDTLTDDTKDFVSKSYTGTQQLKGALEVTDQVDIKAHNDSGSIQIGFSAGGAYLATNNGFSFLSPVHFDRSITTSDTVSYALATPDSYMRKQQVAQAISDITGTHFEKWVTMGTPENLTVTSSWTKVYMPATRRFPNLPPDDIQPNEDGTGFIFKKAGLIHIKRNVSLGIQLYRNIKYQARINNQILEPLYPQTVDQGTMTYSVEFFWQVTPNQELTIWAASQNDDVPLNYLGVTTMVEYL